MSRRKSALLEAGKPRYASKNRGLALLDEAIEQIKFQVKSPHGQWEQDQWRCETGMCLAGWVAQLAGGEWAYDADSVSAGLMLTEPGDNPLDTLSYGPKAIHVADRAERLLQPISEYECDRLFSGHNTLEDIEEIRDEIAEYLTDEL